MNPQASDNIVIVKVQTDDLSLFVYKVSSKILQDRCVSY